MSTTITYVGGTMDTEREQVASAAVATITIPALDGLPEETYVRLDDPTAPTVRFALDTLVISSAVRPGTTTQEGPSA